MRGIAVKGWYTHSKDIVRNLLTYAVALGKNLRFRHMQSREATEFREDLAVLCTLHNVSMRLTGITILRTRADEWGIHPNRAYILFYANPLSCIAAVRGIPEVLVPHEFQKLTQVDVLRHCLGRVFQSVNRIEFGALYATLYERSDETYGILARIQLGADRSQAIADILEGMTAISYSAPFGDDIDVIADRTEINWVVRHERRTIY